MYLAQERPLRLRRLPYLIGNAGSRTTHLLPWCHLVYYNGPSRSHIVAQGTVT